MADVPVTGDSVAYMLFWKAIIWRLAVLFTVLASVNFWLLWRILKALEK